MIVVVVVDERTMKIKLVVAKQALGSAGIVAESQQQGHEISFSPVCPIMPGEIHVVIDSEHLTQSNTEWQYCHY